MKDQVITRRRLVAVLGVGSVGALLAACGTAASPTAAPPAKPTEAPKPAAPAAAAPTTAPAAAAAPTQAPAAAAAPTQAPAAAATKPAAAAAPSTGAAPAGGYTPAKPASGKVTWLVRTTKEENQGQAEIFEPAIKKLLPNVQVERVIVPQEQYIPKINSMAAAKDSLEIWGFGGNYYDYWARGLPQDLTSYIKGDNWDVDNYFQPGLMDIFKVHGKYYGVSQLTTFGSVVAYNRTLFDQAGIKPLPVKWDDAEWTLDRMVEYGTKLTQNAGKPDATYGVSMDLWASMTSFPYLYGSDAWLPEHYTNTIAPKTNFNTPENTDAHQYKQDLIYKHKISPDPAITKAMSQVGSPFETGKIGIELDGGWLFWSTSKIKDFKVNYAALPKGKSNKHINFDDFWIMGRWATNKDAAWQVIRILTDVPQTTAYAVNSGTPPTPRASLNAWLQNVAKFTGQSVEDLTTLTVGAVDPKIAQESPDHLFLQHPKISDTYDQEISALFNNPGATAKDVIPKVTAQLDAVVKGIYDQFKDAIPKD